VFVAPEWKSSIDFDERIAAIPPGANARGMFFQFLVDALEPRVAAQIEAPRFIAFKSYPLRDYVTLLARASRAAFPSLPAAEAVRRLGRSVYPSYARTLTGTAVFAIAGRNYARVIELCPRAYEIGMTPGSVKVRSITPGHAIVELRQIWNVPEFHQVGVWEGGMEVCGVTGTIETRVLDYGAVDFEVRWSG
jgi:uncharacterized protein (TIGR02265 family)